MIRRSRISVRPNVKPGGRASSALKETAQENPTSADICKDEGVKSVGSESTQRVQTKTQPSGTSDPAVQLESNRPAEEVGTQSTTTPSSSVRRKRCSVLPNLTKPRPSPSLTHTSAKSPDKTPITQEIPPSTTHSFTEVSKSPLRIKHTKEPTPEPSAPSSLTSCRPSKVVLAPKLPEPSILMTPKVLKSAVKTALTKDSASVPPSPSVDDSRSPSKASAGVQSDVSKSQDTSPHPKENLSGPTPLPETQLDLPENHPVSEDGDRSVSLELSDKLKRQSGKAVRSTYDPVDRVMLARAKKLRELLKTELNKHKKDKPGPGKKVRERKKEKDHSKMTMRELIYYLPPSNPMKSYIQEEHKDETPLPPSPTATSVAEQEVAEQDEEQQEEEEQEVEEPLLAPRVKVAEDGSLIIDEESLTVQVNRAKGPNPLQDRDPIFERGSTTTYSSFRKGTYTKPWSTRETDMFFLAISMVGMDFSMISQLFPHRARIEIKNKFKKEERVNSWRIDKAFRERQRLDMECFSSALTQILQSEEELRKVKKDSNKLLQRRPAERKRKLHFSDAEEGESLSSDTMEGEKENEEVFKDGARRNRAEETLKTKKKKWMNQADEHDDAEGVGRTVDGAVGRLQESDIEQQSDDVTMMKAQTMRNQRQRNADSAVQREDSVHNKKRLTIDVISCDDSEEDEPDLSAIQEHILNKPTRSGRIPKLSQHVIRAAAAEEEEEAVKPSPPRPPCLTLAPQVKQLRSQLVTLRASTHKDEDGWMDTEDSVHNKKRLTIDIISCDDSEEDEPDLSAIQEHILNKPTRSGRIPKLSQHVIRAAAAEEEEQEEEGKTSLPPPPCLTLAPEVKQLRSQLVTLRASTHEDEEDDEGDYGTNQEEEIYSVVDEEEEEEQGQAFVPMGLRSAKKVETEVEETMEELDISVNPHDVLGISQNALCSDSSCGRVSGPGGSVCSEHHLDLLVGVLDFLTPDDMEVSEEAARTLLTIGEAAHVTRCEEADDADDIIFVEESVSPDQELHEETDQPVTDQSETALQMMSCELHTSTEQETHADSVSSIDTETIIPEPVAPKDSSSQETSVSSHESEIKTSSPQKRRIRLPKPKPNLSRASRKCKEPETQNAPMSHKAPTIIKATPIASSPPDPEKMACSEEKGCSSDRTAEAGEARQVELQKQQEDSLEKGSRAVFGCHEPLPKLIRGNKISHQNPSGLSVGMLKEIHHDDLEKRSHGTESQSLIDSVEEEPIFIISLSEIPPTTTNEEELITEESTSGAALVSGGIGSAGDQVLQADLVPVSKAMQMCEGKDEKKGVKEKSGPADSPVCSSFQTPTEKMEVPVERRNLPERGRRGKGLLISDDQSTTNIKVPTAKPRLPHQDIEENRSPSPAPPAAAGPATESSSPYSSLTPPPSTSASKQSPMEHVVLTEISSTSDKQDTVLGAESQPIHHITPASTASLTRATRRPKGFLSFISSSQRPSSSSSRSSQKPSIRPRTEQRRATPTCLAPPATVSQVSADVSGSVSDTTTKAEEEPSSVSAYFINDIFTEVDEVE